MTKQEKRAFAATLTDLDTARKAAAKQAGVNGEHAMAFKGMVFAYGVAIDAVVTAVGG